MSKAIFTAPRRPADGGVGDGVVVVVERIGGRHQAAEVEAADEVDRRDEVVAGVGVAAADGRPRGATAPVRSSDDVARHADQQHLAARGDDAQRLLQRLGRADAVDDDVGRPPVS